MVGDAMNPGEMNCRITLQQETKVTDNQGGFEAVFNGLASFPGNEVNGKGGKDAEASDGGQGEEAEPRQRRHAVEGGKIGGKEADDQSGSGQYHHGHNDSGGI